jgi:hypothetical protein
MSDSNPYKKEKTDSNDKKENILEKGWNEFVSGMRENYANFQQSLEQQAKRNKEAWEDNQGKFNEFIAKTRVDWENRLNKWKQDVEKMQIDSQKEWEAKKQKMRQDYENWQQKTKKNWEEGLSSWNKFWIKGSYMFLLFMIPILVVIVVIAISIALILRS